MWNLFSIIILITGFIPAKSFGKILFISSIILLLAINPITYQMQPANATSGDLLLTLNNPTPEVGDGFGVSVASTIDGNIIVGAFQDNTGSAYLFDVSTCDNAVGSTPNDNLCEISELTLNNPTPEITDHFGWSVASTPDGDIVVGATGDDTGAVDAGSAYLFDGNTGALLLTLNNPTPEYVDLFGVSVASTPSGNIIVGAAHDDTGAVDAGSAYLFLASALTSQIIEERLTALETKTTDLEITVSDMFNFVIEQFTSLFGVFPSVQTDVEDLKAQIDSLESRITELENP